MTIANQNEFRALTASELDIVSGGSTVEQCNEAIRKFTEMVEAYVYGGPDSGPHRIKK